MKKIMTVGIVAIIMMSAYAVYAGQEQPSDPNTASVNAFIGKICFKYDSYADTYVLRFDQVGDAYQIVGHDPAYPSSIDGGGAIVAPNKLALTFVEAQLPPGGRRAIHSWSLNVTTMKGTDTFSWANADGTGQNPFTALPFSKVACPAVLSPGPKTDP